MPCSVQPVSPARFKHRTYQLVSDSLPICMYHRATERELHVVYVRVHTIGHINPDQTFNPDKKLHSH